jgi:hypothetical protein
VCGEFAEHDGVEQVEPKRVGEAVLRPPSFAGAARPQEEKGVGRFINPVAQ